MKTFHFLIVTLLVFASCTKEDYTPNVKSVEPTHVNSPDSIGNMLQDSLNLSISIPSINVDVHNLKPTSMCKLVEGSEVYGFFISFIDNDGNLYEFKYKIDGNRFENLGSGRVQGHTYLMFIDNRTINFCNWHQNVPFTYSLFGTTSLSKK